MAVFLLKVYHGTGYAPPAATGVFSDVSIANPFAPWIEEMSRLAITSGCGRNCTAPTTPSPAARWPSSSRTTFHRPEATRFLQQATWGPKDSEISGLLGVGYLPWLASQFNLPISAYPTLPLVPDTIPAGCEQVPCLRDNYSTYLLHTTFFKNALYQPDQLRQRVFFALHKLDVISTNTITRPSQVVPYLNLLAQDAFGNYRDLLEDLTLNPAMGAFLNMATNTKTNPNENYSREIMQLFSIGTVQLNQDGTTQIDGGTGYPADSYDQSVVDQLKLVLTGWYIPSISVTLAGDTDDTGNYLIPMPVHKNGSNVEDRHSTGGQEPLHGLPAEPERRGLGHGDPLGPARVDGPPDGDRRPVQPPERRSLPRPGAHPLARHVEPEPRLRRARRRLLQRQRLRPARQSLGDGQGHPARSGSPQPPERPDLRQAQGTGALHAQRPARLQRHVGQRRRSVGRLSQHCPMPATWARRSSGPTRSSRYFPQDYYAPPASAGLLGPEFGIMDATTSLKRANFVNPMTFNNGIAVNCGASSCNAPNGTSINLTELQLLSANPTNLVDRLNRLMMHGTMSDEMKSSIVTAVNAVSANNTLLRARQALYLVATSSQYQVQR